MKRTETQVAGRVLARTLAVEARELQPHELGEIAGGATTTSIWTTSTKVDVTNMGADADAD